MLSAWIPALCAPLNGVTVFGQPALTAVAGEPNQTLIDTSLEGLPQDSPQRPALQQVSRFARLAADNLDLSKPILASIGQPVRVAWTPTDGGPPVPMFTPR